MASGWPEGAGTANTSRARALAAPVAAAGLVASATVVLNRTGGHNLGPLATCWFRSATGLYCPFCGSLRGVAALSHGDLLSAMHDNAPVMLVLGLAALVWVRRVGFALAGKVVDQPRTDERATVALAVFFLLFATYRNTPSGSWLVPLS